MLYPGVWLIWKIYHELSASVSLEQYQSTHAQWIQTQLPQDPLQKNTMQTLVLYLVGRHSQQDWMAVMLSSYLPWKDWNKNYCEVTIWCVNFTYVIIWRHHINTGCKPKIAQKKKKKKKNVLIWHRCSRPGPSSTTHRYFAKKMKLKKAITLIIIGRFYPKSNLTIFYDYIPGYKIWIQYTNHFFKKKYRKENIYWRRKRAITPILRGWFYPTWNMTSILWLYTCV